MRHRVVVAAAVALGCAVAAAPIAAGLPVPAEPTEFVQRAEQMLTDYLTQLSAPRPHLVYIPSTTSVPSPCPDSHGNATQHDRSFDYCPADDTVYIGQEVLWDTYRRYGQAALLSGLAHEYGHAIQADAHVPTPATTDETIRHEDQADCLSGDVIDHLGERGLLTLPDDLAGIRRYLTATASADAPGRDHGTAEERIGAFTLGYDGGLAACSRFYPATPLEVIK